MRYLLSLLVLTSCATPVTMLENPKTGQIARCGGGMSGSVAGGIVGYHIQRNNDDKCVYEYIKQGFIQK